MTRHPSASAHWTVADIPDQTNRRALITGANSGIGFHAALELARHGAHVLLACRDHSKGDAALARLRTQVPQASAEVAILDLASLASVRHFAADQLATGLPIDLLINNAGTMAPTGRQQTADGFELQFGTNVLGHFALTALLLPLLVKAAATAPERPRIVTIASLAHVKGRLNFDDLQWTHTYNAWGAYRQSKLANLMLALELDRRLRAATAPTSRIMSVAAHPGLANTNLFLTGDFPPFERFVRKWMGVAIGAWMNTEAGGAVPTLYAATAPAAQDGGYYGPQGFQEMRGNDAGTAKIAPQGLDQAVATRLWTTCEQLTGTYLPLS